MRRNLFICFILFMIVSFVSACENTTKNNNNNLLLLLGLMSGGSPDGLVVHYPFDDNLTDISGHGYNGTNSGASNITYVSGKYNNAANFNGSNQTLTGPTANYFSTNMTVSFWVNIPSAFAGPHWIVFGPGPAFCGFLHDGTQGKIGFVVSVPATKTAYGSVGTSAWHHVVGTFDGTTMTIYVDGVVAGSVINSGSVSSSKSTLEIGNTSNGSSIPCSIDDFRIYNRVLTSTEISDLYNH